MLGLHAALREGIHKQCQMQFPSPPFPWPRATHAFNTRYHDQLWCGRAGLGLTGAIESACEKSDCALPRQAAQCCPSARLCTPSQSQPSNATTMLARIACRVLPSLTARTTTPCSPEALPTPSTVPCASACAHSTAYPPVVLSPLSAAAPCSRSAVTVHPQEQSVCPHQQLPPLVEYMQTGLSSSHQHAAAAAAAATATHRRYNAGVEGEHGGRLCLVRPSLIHSPCARGATLASSRSSRSACTTRAQASPCERAAAQTSPAAESRKAAAAAGCWAAAGSGRAARRRVASCSPPAA